MLARRIGNGYSEFSNRGATGEHNSCKPLLLFLNFNFFLSRRAVDVLSLQ